MGIFNDFYGKGKEFLEQAKKPFKANELKRKIESTFDDASKSILDVEAKIDAASKNFDNFDMNTLIELESELEAHNKAKEVCKKYYKLEFDKELKDRED